MGKATTNIIYSQKFFDVEERNFLLPHGINKKYSIVHRRPISVIFPLEDDKNLYLILQYRHLFGKRILEAPAGHIDNGETSLDGAKRELREETGLEARSWKKIIEYDSSGSVIESHVSIFLARNLKRGTALPEDYEDIKLIKISLEEAVKKVMSGEISTSSTIIGLLLLDKAYKENKL